MAGPSRNRIFLIVEYGIRGGKRKKGLTGHVLVSSLPRVLDVRSSSITGSALSRPSGNVGICHVSLYTRFSDFSTISSFGFNHSSSELVGIFLEMLEIIPMFVLVVKDFARRRFVAQICANSGILELSQRTCLPILSSNS